jgi:hypothetical protein
MFSVVLYGEGVRRTIEARVQRVVKESVQLVELWDIRRTVPE